MVPPVFNMLSVYIFLKYLHITCVAASGAGFVARGAWMLRAPRMLERRWVRIAPHVVDTVLLASAIALAVLSGQYPFAQNWLTAKLVGLIAYVILGSIALKRGRTRATRTAAFAGALLVFLYIVAVATSKSVLPYVD